MHTYPLTAIFATMTLSAALIAAQLYVLVLAFGWWTLPILLVGNGLALFARLYLLRRLARVTELTAGGIFIYAFVEVFV